ncbi:molybdenum cofactor guanylyltransferase [Leptolyngbya sp. 7M]|uniref:molybdenum cofactor guanylyltransferase n=1 Tax=Leptolyngbya sp. 7M TaxID=2812896 RepID=UPI001B8CBC5A|nr:molybdenum cofactor guanylyltransferase [Leptolyngbya sp. 7M]QYO65872.1 molybdenum cofactor guanylyltransferase [Leptolyngbya sp. 7M]
MIQPFILIGGRSTRFGSPKADVVFEGRSFAVRAAETTEQALLPAKAIFVTRTTDTRTEIAGRQVIADLVPGRGPIGAIYTALRFANVEWIFVLACDLPFVSPDLIWLLKERIRKDSDVIVPLQSDGWNQPLCAFYQVRTCLPVFGKIVTADDIVPSLHSILGMLNTDRVPETAFSHLGIGGRLLRNINTPRDLDI